MKKTSNNLKSRCIPLLRLPVALLLYFLSQKKLHFPTPQVTKWGGKSSLATSRAGFTLIEMVVAIGIFSLVVVTATGITLNSYKARQKAANVQEVYDNARFSLELMTKELRTGVSYQLATFCSLSGTAIKFKATSGWRMYYLDSARKQIFRATTNITDTSQCDGGASDAFEPFTDSNVAIEQLAFYLKGAAAGSSDGQPMVTITTKVSSLNSRFGPETNIQIQTTITSRIRDLL